MHLTFFGQFDFGLGGWILMKATGQPEILNNFLCSSMILK